MMTYQNPAPWVTSALPSWQPPEGWDIWIGDPPSGTLPHPWWGIIPPFGDLPAQPYAPDQRMPDPYTVITTGSNTLVPWADERAHERLDALEAEVQRLGRKCKRLKRKLAEARRRP